MTDADLEALKNRIERGERLLRKMNVVLLVGYIVGCPLMSWSFSDGNLRTIVYCSITLYIGLGLSWFLLTLPSRMETRTEPPSE